ncbi:MAG: EutN/CcmL family microcompartment protein [Deltaproteobacteria bacterium]|nr:EutN/CcmL family microcompartment protein [Deltaproteobacteria bacterium]
MKIGKIIGNVWSDKKVPQLKGCRLHIVQPVSSAEKNVDKVLVVADPQNLAGSGDIVVYVTGTDAAQAFPDGNAPVNASVVKLVDSID